MCKRVILGGLAGTYVQYVQYVQYVSCEALFDVKGETRTSRALHGGAQGMVSIRRVRQTDTQVLPAVWFLARMFVYQSEPACRII